MPDISETAYPRLKSNINQRDLNKIFSPTDEEFHFAENVTQNNTSKLWVLIMLKTFSRIGYFPLISEIPTVIIKHLSLVSKIEVYQEELLRYDNTNSRQRHINNIRKYLNISPYNEKGKEIVATVINEAAKVKDDVCDLINIAVEELVRHNFELPAFSTLVRIVNSIKVAVYDKKQQLESIKKSDELVTKLRDIISAYKTEETDERKLSAIASIIGTDSENVLDNCEAHLATISNNHYSFMWKFCKTYRLAFINILKNIKIYSTNQNTALEKSIEFIKANKKLNKDFIETSKIINTGKDKEEVIQLLDLSWIPDSWLKLITGNSKKVVSPKKINRRHFEVCLFSQIMMDLKSGDIYIEGSNDFSDYREQLISFEEYDNTIDQYSEQVGIPFDSDKFIEYTKDWLNSEIKKTDKSFPSNNYLEIKNGEPILHKLKKKKIPKELKFLESYISEKLKSINILDMLADTEHWLNWTRFFRPMSGYEGKIENPIERYLTTTFCYGCNLGPTQTANSLDNINRKQVAWIDQRHIDEDKLNYAIKLIINSYNHFTLPKYWGSGNRVAADGTKWDMYEENLLSEYHIRYGGYGGIGYYHVSDNYIALFSHFIPCGVWEAVYILDGLLKNESDIKPDTIHADTQGQNTPVFAMSYLLGINLMPRIRNWKHLTFYRPDSTSKYKHINELFSDTIDWNLIKTYLPDMLRIVLSVKAGKITASAILRRLGSYSRNNKLYLAFRELGRAIRTGFLMQYLRDDELRSTIQATTNKNESFNGFTKWLSFGGTELRENNRADQRKIIKYNHLVANCLIFYNVYSISLILNEYVNDGYKLTDEMLSGLSPYITQHINRFGKYELDLDRKPNELDYSVLAI